MVSKGIGKRANRAPQFVGFVLVEASAVDPLDAPCQVHHLRTNDENYHATVERHAEGDGCTRTNAPCIARPRWRRTTRQPTTSARGGVRSRWGGFVHDRHSHLVVHLLHRVRRHQVQLAFLGRSQQNGLANTIPRYEQRDQSSSLEPTPCSRLPAKRTWPRSVASPPPRSGRLRVGSGSLYPGP